MAERNPNQQNQPGQRNQEGEQRNIQPGQRENASSQENVDNNPQSGSEWSNYQTRELSTKEEEISSDDILGDE